MKLIVAFRNFANEPKNSGLPYTEQTLSQFFKTSLLSLHEEITDLHSDSFAKHTNSLRKRGRFSELLGVF
jgi:hypothetical protein